jgi:predicted nucleic acid-binding protein
VKVFLDSNVLFSAALGGGPFELLRDIARAGKIQLVTTTYCHTEAADNLKHKRPDALVRYAEFMAIVHEVPDGRAEIDWARTLVHNKDAPVLAAAVATSADVLVTGDLKHFTSLMTRTDLPLRVRTVRAFLLEGPKIR